MVGVSGSLLCWSHGNTATVTPVPHCGRCGVRFRPIGRAPHKVIYKWCAGELLCRTCRCPGDAMMLPQSKSVLAMEVAALVVVGSASVWPLPVHTHPFVERDPELSMPYVEDAVVSPLLLFVLVLVVAPAAWVLQLAAMRRWSTLKHPALADWRVALLTMYWSLALATALTVLIKCFCGRPRPSECRQLFVTNVADSHHRGGPWRIDRYVCYV